MRILIVESDSDLGKIWQRHLQRFCADVELASDEDGAIAAIDRAGLQVIVLDLLIERGSAFAVADYARFRRPEAKVIFVTNTSFFSDGSIFQHIPNACAFLPSQTRPEDLAALVEHHCRAA